MNNQNEKSALSQRFYKKLLSLFRCCHVDVVPIPSGNGRDGLEHSSERCDAWSHGSYSIMVRTLVKKLFFLSYLLFSDFLCGFFQVCLLASRSQGERISFVHCDFRNRPLGNFAMYVVLPAQKGHPGDLSIERGDEGRFRHAETPTRTRTGKFTYFYVTIYIVFFYS